MFYCILHKNLYRHRWQFYIGYINISTDVFYIFEVVANLLLLYAYIIVDEVYFLLKCRLQYVRLSDAHAQQLGQRVKVRWCAVQSCKHLMVQGVEYEMWSYTVSYVQHAQAYNLLPHRKIVKSLPALPYLHEA